MANYNHFKENLKSSFEGSKSGGFWAPNRPRLDFYRSLRYRICSLWLPLSFSSYSCSFLLIPLSLSHHATIVNCSSFLRGKEFDPLRRRLVLLGPKFCLEPSVTVDCYWDTKARPRVCAAIVDSLTPGPPIVVFAL